MDSGFVSKAAVFAPKDTGAAGVAAATGDAVLGWDIAGTLFDLEIVDDDPENGPNITVAAGASAAAAAGGAGSTGVGGAVNPNTEALGLGWPPTMPDALLPAPAVARNDDVEEAIEPNTGPPAPENGVAPVPAPPPGAADLFKPKPKRDSPVVFNAKGLEL